MAMSPTENHWVVVYTPGDDMSCPEYEKEFREKVEAIRFAATVVEEYGMAEVYNLAGEQVW
jgi:hypothetical protein